MNCQEAQYLLHAYLDGELDTKHSLKVERHLQDCQGCSLAFHHALALRTAIQEDSLYVFTPERLRRCVQSSIQRADQRTGTVWHVSWRALSVAAALIFALFGAWGLFQWRSVSSQTTTIQAQEVLASHIRSFLSNHLVDISSSDESAIKPWFIAKLGFSPPVIDLKGQGYPILGGRLDYLENHMAAVVVYTCCGHVIALFFWPSTQQEKESAMHTTTMRGYALIHWTTSGMNAWAVSDFAIRKLHGFAQLIQQNVDFAKTRASPFQRASF